MHESELIIRPGGTIYHLDLGPDDICDTVITVGDPNRVERISRHFDEVYLRKQNREIVSHKGRLGKKEILVISTGMGTDNVEIVMSELDALANIDLSRRKIKNSLRSLNFIRIGTSGSISTDVPAGSLLASATGTGLDSTIAFYPYHQDEQETKFSGALRDHLNVETAPYHADCDKDLLKIFGNGMLHGHTLTCPGFYAPQGRSLRLSSRKQDYFQRLMSFEYAGIRLTNIEMETAAMYAFGAMMGHRTISLNAIIADRVNGNFASNPHDLIDRLIEIVLERIEEIDEGL